MKTEPKIIEQVTKTGIVRYNSDTNEIVSFTPHLRRALPTDGIKGIETPRLEMFRIINQH